MSIKNKSPEHLELMRFSQRKGLGGKGYSIKKLKEMKDLHDRGVIVLQDIAKHVGVRDKSKLKGFRVCIGKLFKDHKEYCNIALEKGLNKDFVKYAYVETDLTKKDIELLFGVPQPELRIRIEKYGWKKKPNMKQIKTVGALMELIYYDTEVAISIPDREDKSVIHERYRQNFYKLYTRLNRESEKTPPDVKVIEALTSSVKAFKESYSMELEVNGHLNNLDHKKTEILDRKIKIEESKQQGGMGDVTIIDLPENIATPIHALLYKLPELLQAKGLNEEGSDYIMENLVKELENYKEGE